MRESHALYDDFGPGFTLLDFGATEGAAAFVAATKLRGVPLKVLAPTPLEPYRSRLVLIRPDQHICWHGDSISDATAVIDRVRGA